MAHNQPLFIVLLTLCIAGALAVTTQQDQEIGAVCDEIITQSNQVVIPRFVRLAFHDCIGGCDGCVDINLTESTHGDRVNAGLNRVILDTREAYNNLTNPGISFADFIAKCAHVAAEQGRKNAGNSKASDFPMVMRYGRVDCDGRPRAKAEDFPNPRMGLDGVLSWCSRVFKFSERECVAIMGAHTLGRAGPSGYTFPWVAGVFHLDNSFYVELIKRKWKQENVVPEEAGDGARWQYSFNNSQLMLNTDMCLQRDISPDQFGKAETNPRAVRKSSTASIVKEYALNNTLWLNDFGRAFTKLMETGNKLTGISDSVIPDYAAGYIPKFVPRYSPFTQPNNQQQASFRSSKWGW